MNGETVFDGFARACYGDHDRRGGREAVALRFEISLSSVGRYIKRFREKGSLAPDKFGGHKRHTLADEEERLRGWIAERPDMTLAEIKARLREIGIEVGQTGDLEFSPSLGFDL